MWILLLSMMTCSLHAMEKSTPLFEDEIDEITKRITVWYFDKKDSCVIEKLTPKVKNKINTIYCNHHNEFHFLYQLQQFKVHANPYAHGDSDFKQRVSQLMHEALEDDIIETNWLIEDLQNRLKRQEYQKYASIVAGILSTLITASVSLIVHFV